MKKIIDFKWTWLLVLTSVLFVIGACDFTVTNPGPVQDEFLNDNSANLSIVNGSGRMLAEALNWVGYTGGAIVREVTPSGSIGSFGISPEVRNGELNDDQINTQWNFSQRARSVSEQGLAHLRQNLDADFSSSPLAAQILIWAAYSNRLIGENFCCTVIDGGAAESINVARARAEGQFTEAMTVASSAGETDLAWAAQAGRAAVRMWLGDWTNAVSDAQAVLAAAGNDWSYDMPYFDIGDQVQFNRIYYAGSGDGPYRAHTVWHSPYEETAAAGDARTPMGTEAGEPFGDATVDGDQIPWLFQLKHDNRESSIRLSSSQEMQLILAENELVNGSEAAAIAFINAVRTTANQPAVAGDGWTLLKRERGIELWLEGRRLGDIRRWEEAGRPGDYNFWEVHDWKGPDDGSGANARPFSGIDLSFPIGLDEQDTNPNVTEARPST